MSIFVVSHFNLTLIVFHYLVCTGVNYEAMLCSSIRRECVRYSTVLVNFRNKSNSESQALIILILYLYHTLATILLRSTSIV